MNYNAGICGYWGGRMGGNEVVPALRKQPGTVASPYQTGADMAECTEPDRGAWS